MLRKVSGLFSKNQIIFKSLQSFSAHEPIPTKLKKVQEITVKFNVKNADGQPEQIHAFKGQSFLHAIRRSKVRGFQYSKLCYGSDFTYRPHQRPVDPFTHGPQCGGCRIILRENWFERIKQETGNYVVAEEWVLLSRPDHREDMRLSCCLPVQAWMEGCTFQIAPDTQISERKTLI